MTRALGVILLAVAAAAFAAAGQMGYAPGSLVLVGLSAAAAGHLAGRRPCRRCQAKGEENARRWAR